jgi:anti-sigma-K factor RskA
MHPSELLPGYALGSLTADEITRVAEHLPRCQACTRELDEFRQTAGLLGFAAAQVVPPPDLRGRVIDRVRAVRATSTRRYRSRRLLVAGWAVAAALGLLAIGLGGLAWNLTQQVQHKDRVLQAAQLARLAASSDLEMVRFQGGAAAPEAWGTLLGRKSGTFAYVALEKLPPLPNERAYQIWITDTNGERVSGGLLRPDAAGWGTLWIETPAGLGTISRVGLTEEPVTGSAWPTGASVCYAEVH